MAIGAMGLLVGALIALLWETSITSLNSALPTDTVEASPGQIVDGASGIG